MISIGSATIVLHKTPFKSAGRQFAAGNARSSARQFLPGTVLVSWSLILSATFASPLYDTLTVIALQLGGI